MDAITLLRDDHKSVEKLFKQFERAKKKDGSPDEKLGIVNQIIEELVKHAFIEEQLFYPAVRQEVEEAEDVVLEGLEEHHIVKWTLSELDGMSPSEERFDAKVTVLIESVRHHVEEEEGEMFPEVRKSIKGKELKELGQRMLELKASAPTKPQPKAPDEPARRPVAKKR
jgi:hemerythrin superfamily protein